MARVLAKAIARAMVLERANFLARARAMVLLKVSG